jgi:hypothetical protein
MTVRAESCELRRAGANVVLILEAAGEAEDVAAVMSPKETRHLANRLGKAANDAAAAAARQERAA